MRDPFETKLQNHDIKLKETAEYYMNGGKYTNGIMSQTTLTYLVIATNLDFTTQQYQYMLGFKPQPIHQLMYAGILIHVKSVAYELYQFFHFKSLLDIPLTNLKDIAYQIGLNFKEIFFSPVISYVMDNSRWTWDHSCTPSKTIKYISKYNEMWIITCLLNREYRQLS